jgi:hypothetical protein
MKLLLCPRCQDVKKLQVSKKMTYCKCRKSYGRYIDELYAEIGGLTIPIGFDNWSLRDALDDQPEDGMGERFTAFVIPKKCDTIKNLNVDN